MKGELRVLLACTGQALGTAAVYLGQARAAPRAELAPAPDGEMGPARLDWAFGLAEALILETLRIYTRLVRAPGGAAALIAGLAEFPLAAWRADLQPAKSRPRAGNGCYVWPERHQVAGANSE